MEGIDTTVPVLVVGAGPAGLATAITLAHHGIRSLVVERRRGLSDLPRATGISTRTMELIRSWGIEKEVRSAEIDVRPQGWLTATLTSGHGKVIPVGLPTPEQAALVSPTAPARVPQDQLEPVLLRHLQSFRDAEVRFATELVALDQRHGGVTAELRHVSGVTSTVHAKFVVAADGTHSTVRSIVGIQMDGPSNLVEHVTAVFRAPLWDVVGPRRYGIYMTTHAEAGGVFVPVDRGNRWLYGRELDAKGSRPADATPARMLELIRLGSGLPALDPAIEQIGRFSFAAQVARRYRHGRTFLVGDAAHRMTPRGGTGLNTAVHDGHDLGWKLAWTIKGWSTPGFLNTYEAERRPIGVHNTARSAEPAGRARMAHDALAVDIGGRVPHMWLRRDGRQVSTLDVLGRGFTLVTGVDGSAWRSAASRAGVLVPIDVHGVDDVTAGVLGIHRRGARLLRPDGQTVAWWRILPGDPLQELRHAVDDLLGGTTQKAAA